MARTAAPNADSDTNSLSNIFVFVARFSDGRMKDRLRFEHGESVQDASENLPTAWSGKDVYVDNLGEFADFYRLAPELEYDLKRDRDIPDTLQEHIEVEQVEHLLDVAGNSNTSDSLPVIPALDGEESMMEVLYSDKLSMFRKRLRRLVKNDVAEYDSIDTEYPQKHGIRPKDIDVSGLLKTLREAQLQAGTGIACIGVLLRRNGTPYDKVDTWTEDEWRGTHNLEDYEEYDAVLKAKPRWSMRKTQHQALNTLNRYLMGEHDGDDHHEWHFIDVSQSDRVESDFGLLAARNHKHAHVKSRFSLGTENDSTTYIDSYPHLETRVESSGLTLFPEYNPSFVVDPEFSENQTPNDSQRLLEEAVGDSP